MSLPSADRVKAGRFQCLINKVEEAESRGGTSFLRASATVLVPLTDGRGREPGDEEYDGHFKGDDISFVFFFGDRFSRDFSPFLMAGLGMTVEQAKDISDEELMETLAAVVREEGQEEPGIFDGSVVIEMRGVLSKPTKSKKEVDSEGNPKLVQYLNERFDKQVPLSSLAETLTEQDLERYFGSAENFFALVEAED